jgi:hypothetical protein
VGVGRDWGEGAAVAAAGMPSISRAESMARCMWDRTGPALEDGMGWGERESEGLASS